MDSRPNRIHLAVLAVCAALASAALLYFGSGLQPLWPLMWLAPFPIFWLAGRLSSWQAFAIALLVYFIGGFNLWNYLHGMIQLPAIVTLIFLLLPSIAFGLVVLAYRRFIRQGSLWMAAVAAPAAWVSYEYLSTLASPHSTFGSIAYTQMNCLPVLQLASLTGIWGISFFVFLMPAMAAAVLSGRGSKAQALRLMAGAGAAFAMVILYGVWRLSGTPAADRQVAVAMMATDQRDKIFPMSDDAVLKLLGEYSDQVRGIQAIAKRSPSIVVLPEKIGLVSDNATGLMDSIFKETAARTKATVIVGVDRGTRIRRFNEARAYSPEGTLKAVYHKHHMIPGFEDVDQPGTTRTTWKDETGIWGIEICKDMDFPQLSRNYGRDGVGLLLVPAWDFRVDGWLHGRMAIMRGIESGFTIVRAAKQGLLTVSDNRGRVSAEQGSAAAPFSLLFANAPVWHADTLYALWGDWFAWLTIAALIALLGRTLTQPRS